jgi:hypothetical protein
MKRGGFVLFVFVELLFASSHVGWAAEPAAGSPEAVFSKATNAANHGRFDEFCEAVHPDALKEFHTIHLEVIDAFVRQGEEADVLKTFPGIKSVKELKTLSESQFLAEYLRATLGNPEMKTALAATRIDILGRIDKGPDSAYVVYRATVKLGKVPLVREFAAPLRKSGPDWKLELPDDLAADLPLMRLNIPGKLTIPDIKKMRIELIGHVLDTNETAFIVYRTITPIGDSSMSKHYVLGVNKKDTAWAAVRAGKIAATKALIEKRLGIRQTTGTTTRTRVTATATASASTSTRSGLITSTATATASATASTTTTTTRGNRSGMSARPSGSIKSPPRIATRTPSRTRSKSRTTRPPASEESELPDGLTALPGKFFGNNRDRFHDLAPADGVLVGARVSYIMRFGGPKISSVQPVYRVGEKLVDGERHGGLLGEETSAVAKPGYAVGAVNTHTGLTVDGFEMVFMRIDGDHLDTADSYNSPWLGDENGGSPRDVSSDGKIPVGLQGRAGKEVNALGLIVGK